MTFDKVIESIKERYIQWDAQKGPGISIGVRNKLERRFYNIGLSCVESNTLIKETTRFHAASLAKQITALAITLLESDGKLSVNDAIAQYLPQITPECAKEVTIKQLLNHTSGIRDQWVLLSLAGWKAYEPITMGDVEYLIKRQRSLNYSPGSSHSYCNTGYTMLAWLVEEVSGQPFCEFVAEKIFKAAEMNNSRFRAEFNETSEGEALAYYLKESDGDRKFYRSLPPLSVYGATSLITSTEDLLKWGSYLNQLSVTSPGIYNNFMEVGALESGKVINYGRGVIHWEFYGEKAIFHGGWDYGFSSFFLHFPDHDVSISLLANCYEPNLETLAFYISSSILNKGKDVQNDIENRLKIADEDSSVISSESETSLFSGLYQCEDDLDIKPIKAINQRLFLDIAQGFNLIKIGHNRYAIQGTMVEIEFANDKEMIFSSFGNEKNYKKLENSEGSSYNHSIEGRYFSEELNVNYEVSYKGDSLSIAFPRNEEAELEYLGSGVYLFGGMLVSFEKCVDGSNTTMLINHPRAKNIKFNKIQ